ncbi:MAG: family 16 glycosylhydrolase [Chitinophagaceae bacterium]|nr:family 16 glycosylhydrolase [Chitinophagaceae bacterium]
MRKFSFLFLIVMSVLQSCSKSSGNDSGAGAPTNLQVTAVVNPDNSGNVLFTATATNAVSYEFNFGNGSFLVVPSGVQTYKYTATDTYTVTVVAKSVSGQTVNKSVQVTINLPVALFWSDEFNTDGPPDPTKWGYDLGGDGWGNSELQYYTNRAENAIVQGGILKIKALKETFGGRIYTSARLLSLNKFAFTYGKVEVRAKIPSGVGTWPAIWMLGSNITTTPWPACGEIDIMEHRGSELNKIFGTLHYPGRSGGTADGRTITLANATTEFHIYKLEWSRSEIKIYANDQLVHTVINSTAIPFNRDFFFILNLAMGGTFGGSVDPAFSNATMEVDYVRVYK